MQIKSVMILNTSQNDCEDYFVFLAYSKIIGGGYNMLEQCFCSIIRKHDNIY